MTHSSSQHTSAIDDQLAFSHIVEEHQAMVYGFLRARLLQSSDAEDLAQEVFLRFYQGRGRFDQSQPLRPWLIGIARNVLKEHVTKVTRRKEVAWTHLCLELDELVQFDESDSDDALHYLSGCLESLGPSAKEAIHLKYHQDYRLAEIGERLKRSEGAIKLLMFRARQALRHCLNGKLGSSDYD